MASIKDHFELLARYNSLANGKMYGILSGLEDSDRKKTVGSYFKSIHGILNHVLVSDILWLNRFHGWQTDSVVLTDHALNPDGVSWGQDLYELFADLSERRKAVDDIIRRWIDELPEDRYTEIAHYRDFRNNPRQYVVWTAIDHFFNHQTHHRGAIAQILDEMGVENDYSNIMSIL